MRREVDETRRQTLLSNLPVLKVKRPHPIQQDRGLLTVMEVENAGNVPALDVEIRLFTESDEGVVRDSPFGQAMVPLLAPGDYPYTSQINSLDVFNMGLTEDQIAEAIREDHYPPYYTYRHVVVVAEAKSVLGSRIVQRYRWITDSNDQYAWGWELQHVEIAADPLRPDDREVVDL